MSISTLLDGWRANPSIAPNVAAWRVLPARPARFVPFPSDLHPSLAGALHGRGIRALYRHQAVAFQVARSGGNPVVVTGTASGKTLCYHLPVLQALLTDPTARALCLFPTKALAQDQKNQLDGLLAGLNLGQTAGVLSAATYDGDTPSGHRQAIRTRASVVLSNPDMLHQGVLPHHTLWADFFRGLRFVILDEMHACRGVFGSHVANVLRRLKRVAAFYGAAPQFVLTSATIANPVELAERLVEATVTLVDEDGSARGERHLLIYNPPVVDRDLGLRRSSTLEAVRLTRDLLDHGVQTILFGRARQAVERMLVYLRQDEGMPKPDRRLPTERPSNPQSPIRNPQSTIRDPQSEACGGEAVRGYRSGYLSAQRREIEAGLREGSVRAVVATNALELGIDIGGMDAAVLAGYPGTVASAWQQIGRAGRQRGVSLAAMVASAGPLDQFLARHSDYFFGRSPERALINPDNLLILLGHLRCAAFELPFQDGDAFGRVPGPRVEEFMRFLQDSGVLHRSGDRFFWMADRYPADDLTLRSASAETVVLQAEGPAGMTTVGHVDRASAPWMVHPNAVYLHEGQTYVVEALDLTGGLARLRKDDVDFYTVPRNRTTISLLEARLQVDVRGGQKGHGELSVTTQVVGFEKVRWFTHERLGAGDLDLPPSDLQTTGFWMGLSEETVEGLRERSLWRNDPNDYGPAWPVLRNLVRARDSYRCQACGVPENGPAHDVHHRIPFRSFTSPDQANRQDNLVTLCPPCHYRAEQAVRVRSGLAGMAFVLGHLAPLFVMCDPRDLGVHSDPASPLTDGRPTVVLYDLIPAGIGLAERLFELHEELVGRAADLVGACECGDGCPSCVGPTPEHGPGCKGETMAILEALRPHRRPGEGQPVRGA